MRRLPQKAEKFSPGLVGRPGLAALPEAAAALGFPGRGLLLSTRNRGQPTRDRAQPTRDRGQRAVVADEPRVDGRWDSVTDGSRSSH